MYGYLLRKLTEYDVKVKVHFYVEQSNRRKVKKIVDALWKANISQDEYEEKKIKKSIANINFGLLEKSHNTAQISKMFSSLRECCYYQSVFVGKVRTRSKVNGDWSEVTSGESRDDDDDVTYFVLNVSDTQKLNEGFRLIKEMILQNHNFAMFEAYAALQAKKAKVYSVRCDAFTVQRDDLDLVIGHRYIGRWMKGALDIGKGIGQWKVEEKKHLNFPVDVYRIKLHEFIEISKLENEDVEVEDELDTAGICQKLEIRSPCIIKGKYPGTGKPYIAEHFKEFGKQVWDRSGYIQQILFSSGWCKWKIAKVWLWTLWCHMFWWSVYVQYVYAE